MKRINFKDIPFDSVPEKKRVVAQSIFKTADNIELKSFYDAKDTQKTEHIGFVSGIAPYLRGPYSSMYAIRPKSLMRIEKFNRGEITGIGINIYQPEEIQSAEWTLNEEYLGLKPLILESEYKSVSV